MLAGDIFNTEFRKIGDDWTKRPITLTLAGIQTQAVGVGGGAAPPVTEHDAARTRALTELRNELERREEQIADERMREARDHVAVEHVRVPAGEFESWFGGADGR
jgi:hypothetical protein